MQRLTLLVTRHEVEYRGVRKTLFFTVPALRRRQPTFFLKPDEVPEFDGPSAWFECQKVGRRMIPVRRAPPPHQPHAARSSPVEGEG